MNICIHRNTQRGHGWSDSVCLRDKRVCPGARQVLCTALELWPFWLGVVVLTVVYFIA